MRYINEMQILNLDLAGEYLLMAALLLAIKSRMLLPKPDLTNEIEDEDEADPRTELIRRLLEYEKIKLGAQEIDKLPIANRDFHWLNVNLQDNLEMLPEVIADDLIKAWHNLLANSKKTVNHQIKREELSIRQFMSNILRILTNVTKTTFFALFEENMTIPYIVVNFIAILELTKEGLIKITTENDIIVISNNQF